ncbi:hypothetical protein ElyMa_006199500 [Elysia marginata]|uniref:Uncharacterized protein n=1 Tax=Elysia marginata TaxID=1093978 RepID=A0AAV4H412_9GAST|nr:hypothetical protein ElyMa_006199500 [Elysia marginata]
MMMMMMMVKMMIDKDDEEEEKEEEDDGILGTKHTRFVASNIFVKVWRYDEDDNDDDDDDDDDDDKDDDINADERGSVSNLFFSCSDEQLQP